MALRGEDLTRPTYEALRTMHGGSINKGLGVYHHKVLGIDVVQKTIDMAGRHDAAAYTEPRLLHTIRHDHIVPVHEAQFDPDVPDAITFVMPVYEGGSVEKALDADYRFSLEQARRLGVHLLSALAHVHTVHGYIHRDVKPGNLLLDGSRANAYLSDFGSAAEIGPDGTVGPAGMTPFYTPPEAGLGRPVTVTGDVYSAGLVAFEMFDGPFPYDQIGYAQVMKRLAEGRRAIPDSWIEFAPHVPSRIRRTVRKAIDRDPARRWSTAAEFARALDRVELIDWRHDSGDGLEGEWFGRWPPHFATAKQARYRVTSEPKRGGKLRVVAQQAVPGGGWRQFGVAARTTDPDDVRALEAVFGEIADRAAQLRPAR
jgi:eukaryotic-like serine/threonine-protein kinase